MKIYVITGKLEANNQSNQQSEWLVQAYQIKDQAHDKIRYLNVLLENLDFSNVDGSVVNSNYYESLIRNDPKFGVLIGTSTPNLNVILPIYSVQEIELYMDGKLSSNSCSDGDSTKTHSISNRTLILVEMISSQLDKLSAKLDTVSKPAVFENKGIVWYKDTPNCTNRPILGTTEQIEQIRFTPVKDTDTHFAVSTIKNFLKSYSGFSQPSNIPMLVSNLIKYCDTVCKNNPSLPCLGDYYPVIVIEAVFAVVFPHMVIDKIDNSHTDTKSDILLSEEDRINQIKTPCSAGVSLNMSTIDYIAKEDSIKIDAMSMPKIEVYCTKVCKNNVDLPYSHGEYYPTMVIRAVLDVLFPNKCQTPPVSKTNYGMASIHE